MTNIVYIATSMDGFIAKEDGNIDWLHEIPNPDNSDFGFNAFISGIDAIIMGRKTFETVMGFDFWPYNRPVFVLSKTMKQVPEKYQGKVEIISGELVTILTVLRERDLDRFYIDGGKTIQSFLAEDLIDEMTITRLPVLLGKGIPLFDDTKQILWFDHLQTEVLLGALVKSTYRRKR
jgi:dihydrofolate reductase